MNSPIHDPKEFFKLFCKAARVTFFDPTDRACVILRAPSIYGRVGTVLIEWEGSPPRVSIYYPLGGIPIVDGKQVKLRCWIEAVNIINRFLEAHPANSDETPVWIGTRYKDKP